MCERVLPEVVELHKLQAALGAGVRSGTLMFEDVVLQLAAIGEGLVTLCALEGVRAFMAGLMSFQMGISGELHVALGAHMAASTLVFHFMRPQLAGIGKTPAAEAAAVGLDVSVLEHVTLQVTGLGKTLLAHGAFVWPRALVGQQMCLEVAGLLEEFPTVRAGVWFDAIVSQNVCDKVVLGGVGFVTHATLPAFEAIANIHTVRLVNLNIDVQPVHSATSLAPRCLRLLRLLMLSASTPIRPHHALTTVLVFSPHSHLTGVVTAHFAGLEVAADGFLLWSGLHHIVPLVFHPFSLLSTSSPMGAHRPWGLHSPVGRRICCSVVHLARRRVGVDRCLLLRLLRLLWLLLLLLWLLVRLLVLYRCFSVTLGTVFIGDSQSGWIYLDKATSLSHVVEHMDTRGNPRAPYFPFHMRHCPISPWEAMALWESHFSLLVRRRGLLPPSLTAAGLHLSVLSQVVSEVISVSSNKLVCVFVVHTVYWGCWGLFGFTSVEAIGCNGSSENFIL